MLLAGEAIFGTKTANRKFGTKRRLRAHQRWDTKNGWKVFEENLGTRSSTKRFEDQVAVGGGKWQGHGGDAAEYQCLSTSCATTGFFAPRVHGELSRAQGAARMSHCARSLEHSRAWMTKVVEKDSDVKARKERQEEKDNVHFEKFLNKRFQRRMPRHGSNRKAR